jgi:hypothetical protein
LTQCAFVSVLRRIRERRGLALERRELRGDPASFFVIEARADRTGVDELVASSYTPTSSAPKCLRLPRPSVQPPTTFLGAAAF